MNELEKEYKEKIDFKLVKVDEESKKEIKDAKLKSHGIVAKNKDSEIVMIVEGHKYTKDKVVEVVNKILEKKE